MFRRIVVFTQHDHDLWDIQVEYYILGYHVYTTDLIIEGSRDEIRSLEVPDVETQIVHKTRRKTYVLPQCLWYNYGFMDM